MVSTLAASLAAIALFLLLMLGARRGLGTPGLSPRARRLLAAATAFAFPWLVYAVVRLLDDAEPLQPLATFFDRHRAIGLWTTIPATALGFVLFMGGILHLLLTSGPSETFTLGELKRAVRHGLWVRSGLWRRRIVLVTGVALLVFGLFGLAVVLGPPGVKLLVATVLLYLFAMGVVGLVRA